MIADWIFFAVVLLRWAEKDPGAFAREAAVAGRTFKIPGKDVMGLPSWVVRRSYAPSVWTLKAS
jgi:hypothetical protein